jgi:predicted O-methyltransferase YrrM
MDPMFQSTVARLRVPGMGTEMVAPLLANLVALVRPQRVLEVGMGYTTPFLAAALADVHEQVEAERVALAAKTNRHLGGDGGLDDDWLLAEPALLAPESFVDPYRPALVAVDNLSIAESSAALVWDVLRELNLDRWASVVNADLRNSIDRLPADFHPIDLAWVDAWECLYFFDHFWDLINPDGGLVVMHYLMTYPEGEAVVRYISEFQRRHPGELETVNLLESHKLMQNSITILRRTAEVKPRRYAGRGGKVRYSDELYTAARRQAADAGMQSADTTARD